MLYIKLKNNFETVMSNIHVQNKNILLGYYAGPISLLLQRMCSIVCLEVLHLVSQGFYRECFTSVFRTSKQGWSPDLQQQCHESFNVHSMHDLLGKPNDSLGDRAFILGQQPVRTAWKAIGKQPRGVRWQGQIML